MKRNVSLTLALIVLSVTQLVAQNVSARTTEFEVDLSDPKNVLYGSDHFVDFPNGGNELLTRI